MNEETRNIPPIVAYARQMPDRVAYRMLPSGATVTWRELEQRSRCCAAALLAAGLRTGDVVAVFLENHPRYFELLWAAHRIGLYYTTISRHLKREEAQYIIADCDARVLFHSSHTQAELDPARLDAAGVIRISMDGAAAGAADYEDWLARQPEDVSLPDTPEGTDFLYSSGTTGLPRASSAHWRRPTAISASARRPAAPGRPSAQTRSTCPPRRSTMPRRCAGTWPCCAPAAAA